MERSATSARGFVDSGIPVFTSSEPTCQFQGSPQPSYPLRLGISTNDWNTVEENKEIADDDHEEITDPTNNQEMPYEPSLQKFEEYLEHILGSSYHSGEGNLEGVHSIDEITLDDIFKFCESGEHSMQDTLPLTGGEYGYKEKEETSTEHAMRDTPPMLSGRVFSDSSACSESGYKENEEINPKKKRESEYKENEEINPRKKQRRFEQAGEGESSCKGCICKKSKCLMLYCGCFAAGVYCEGPCDCINCLNKLIHKDTVLAARKRIESRKSLAFAPKVIRTTPKRGCSCKKGCQMKYCACYQSGVGCSSSYCRCEGCKNKFGSQAAAALPFPILPL